MFNAAYEGPPGNVHGGMVAAAFDEVLGMAQSLSGNAGFTGTLTIRYRSPTPLYEPLLFRGLGRPRRGTEDLHVRNLPRRRPPHGGSRRIFITVDREKFETLLRERAEREGGAT